MLLSILSSLANRKTRNPILTPLVRRSRINLILNMIKDNECTGLLPFFDEKFPLASSLISLSGR